MSGFRPRSIQLFSVLAVSSLVLAVAQAMETEARETQPILEVFADRDRSIAQTQSFPADEDEAFQAYLVDRDYEFRDAEILADFWGISVWDAKIALGRKLLSGPEGKDRLDRTLAVARTETVRSTTDEEALQIFFASTEYGFRDAQALANFWSIPIADAKVAIGNKLVLGTEGKELLDGTLALAREQNPSGPIGEEEALRTYFANTEYGFRDAEVLANFWGIPIRDAKVFIGRKLLFGDEGKGRLDRALASAWAEDPQANRELQQFFDAGYSFNDAEALAGFWGLSIQDAKLLAGRKLIDGRQDIVEDALRSARSRF